MWIIFDLDDTLIDTAGSIMPRLLKNALIAMQKSGLELLDPDKAYRDLLSINEKHLRAREALEDFLCHYKAPSYCLPVGLQELYKKPRLEKPIFPVPYAKEVLQELARDHLLFLVTAGREDIQRKKMVFAGIEENIFSSCHFCSPGNKKIVYEKIAKKADFSLSHIWVCGDRISMDLSPAKELGCKTIQIKRGRGKGNSGLKRDVDYTIFCLREIKDIVKKFQKKSLRWE